MGSLGARLARFALAVGLGVSANARPPAADAPAVGDALTDSRNPVVERFSGKRLDLWSLRLPVVEQVPDGSAQNPIDRFVDAALQSKGLRAAAEADRRTLIRRVTFDLTGLPPTPGEVAAFLSDTRPDAYDRVVDRLLASRRYGEHQARWWLDAVRYSDSNGFDWDEFRPQAWRFRDYVIRAFNQDKPFEAFVREQLAGDELVSGAPSSPAEQDALIATGYLRLGPHDNAAPLFNEQDRSRAELMADLVETTGSAFLGLTFSCCRCHDHKFDPLLQTDHYRMRAFFEGVRFADDLPLDVGSDQAAIRAHNSGIEVRIEPLVRERDTLLEGVRGRLRAERESKLSEEERRLLATPEASLSPNDKGRLEGVRRKVQPSDKEVKAALKGEEKARHGGLESEIGELKRLRRNYTLGLVMTDSTNRPPTTHVLFQGDHKAPREPVEPGFPAVLRPGVAAPASPANPATSGRRLTLANWVASAGNPWSWRVIVNRVWQQHFGRGLVSTPNDFGLAGDRPAHPDLLDWLAIDFQRGGGSFKSLHRRIVTSAAYRRSSTSPVAGDPENLLLAVQNPRRLTAEQLRDSLLAVSGLLREVPGGPPVWPDLPPEILQANPAFLDDNETRTKGWYPSPRPEQTVRSVFLVQKRTVRVPFLETFDQPENSVSCARRVESTVAPQALSLLNSSMSFAAAQALAARVSRENPGRPLEHAFLLALQREPIPAEIDPCRRLLKERGLTELCRALLNLNEFAYLD